MKQRKPRSRPIAGELIVRSGADCSIARSLLVPVTLIGQAEHCDLRILEDDVRRVHCVVSVTPEGPHLRSVGGTTLVNGVPSSARLLRTGDILTIGPVELEVHWYLPPGPLPNDSSLGPNLELSEVKAVRPCGTMRAAG